MAKGMRRISHLRFEETFPESESLTKLDKNGLFGFGITDDDHICAVSFNRIPTITALRFLQNFVQLVEINIDNFMRQESGIIDTETITCLNLLSNLKGFLLRGIPITVGACQCLGQSGVSFLRLRDAELSDEHLLGLVKIPELQSLTIVGNSEVSVSGLSDLLTESPLTSLYLRKSDYDTDSITWLLGHDRSSVIQWLNK